MSNMLNLRDPLPVEQVQPEVVELEPIASEPIFAAQTENSSSIDNLDSFLTPQQISWEAHHPLSGESKRKHYIALGAFTLAGTLIALWQANWLTFFVVIVGVFAWEVREKLSRPVQVSVDGQGVTVDGQHYPHVELASFDMHQMPDNTISVSLQTNQWHAPHLRLPLAEQDHQEVLAVLSQYLPQERHPVPRLEYWIRS